MRHKALAWMLVASCAFAGTAAAQTFSARRMAMGGVILAGGGPGSDAVNVAYRAVPPARGMSSGVTLPLGLIPFLVDLPTFDPKNPDFNIYEIGNALYNPPWNLQLISVDPPSNDISISIARNSLAVDLGDAARLFPRDRSRIGMVHRAPSYTVGIRQLFVGVAPMVAIENDLRLNDALRGAVNGAPFLPRTEYAMSDHGTGQAAAGVQFGWAAPIALHGDPRSAGGSAFYAGARVRVMRGLAYGDADNVVAFTTGDTLFSASPVNVHYDAMLRDAGPEGGRLGRAFDLGAAWLAGGLEVGVGVNDIATRIDWRVKETHAFTDSVTGEVVQQVLREGAPWTSDVPTTVSVNAAMPVGRMFVAVDVVRDINATIGHLGVETWSGPFALRAGGSIDANQQVQFSAGSGFKFGRLGLDVALATNSRNVSRERGLELGAGLAFYH